MNSQAKFEITASDETKAAVASVMSGLSGISSRVGIVGAAIATVTSGAMVAFMKSQIDNADALDKLAQKMNMSTESASAFGYAARYSDLDTNQLAESVKKLSQAQVDAQKAGSDHARLFEALGVSTREVNGDLRSSDELLMDLADAFQSLPAGALKTDAAIKLFGRSGLDMLKDGRAGLEGFRKEAENLGLVIDGKTGKAAAEFNDNMARLEARMEGLANRVLPSVVEWLNKTADSMGLSAYQEGNRSHQMAEELVKLNVLYKSQYMAAEAARKAAKSGNENAANALSGYQSAAAKTLADIKAVEDKIAKINGSNTNMAALGKALSGSKGGKPYDPEADKEIEAQRKAMIDLYAHAYPMAMQTTEQWAQEQAKLALAMAENNQREQEMAAQALASHEYALMQRVTAEEQSRLTEEQRMAMAFSNRQMMVEEAAARELISEDQKNKLIIGINDERRAYEEAEEQRHLQQRLAIASGMAANMSSLMQSDSKRQFEIGKKFALANAVIKGYEAIVSSYAAGAKIGGPWLGAAYAATAAVATKINIDAIRGQQFGGGGGAAPGAGGTVSVNQNTGVPQVPISGGAAKQQQGATLQVFINGAVNENFVRDNLIPMIAEQVNSNDVSIISVNSRDAQDIIAAAKNG